MANTSADPRTLLATLLATLLLTATTTTATPLTNLSAYTGSVLKLPAPDADLPEVVRTVQRDFFEDVYEPDTETPWRRLEIVTLISFPPVFLVANLGYRLAKAAWTRQPLDLVSDLSLPETLGLYGSTLLASGLLGLNDYRLVREAKRREGLDWSLWPPR